MSSVPPAFAQNLSVTASDTSSVSAHFCEIQQLCLFVDEHSVDGPFDSDGLISVTSYVFPSFLTRALTRNSPAQSSKKHDYRL